MALKKGVALVQDINASPTKAVIVATGGGSGIFSALLALGGGSNTLLAGYVPYSSKEAANLLGRTPEKMVSGETARSLAMAAYQKALLLKDGDYEVVGLACTASLQRVPEERAGRTHAIHVAMQTKDTTREASLVYTDAPLVTGSIGATSIRLIEEEICVQMMLNELAYGCGIEHTMQVDIADEGLISYDWIKSKTLGYVLSGDAKFAYFDGSGPFANEYTPVLPKDLIIFPGSFNPMHDGHREMLDIVRAKTGNPNCYPEISITNVDKPAIDFISIRNRVKSIGGPCFITNAPTFVNKSQAFPGAKFIVGHDTYTRILNPKYAGTIEYVCSMFKGNNNYFYIFPRDGKAEGLWGTPDTVLPGEFIMEPRKNGHLSSTQLRKAENKA